jgi:hypothetical protein
MTLPSHFCRELYGDSGQQEFQPLIADGGPLVVERREDALGKFSNPCFLSKRIARPRPTAVVQIQNYFLL